MPGAFAYLDDCDLYVTAYWGGVSLPDLLETISHRMQDPDLGDARWHVIDLSNATWSEPLPNLAHADLQRVRPAFSPPKVPTVLVAPSEFFFGFARMYAIFQVAYGGARVEVARSWSDATALTGANLKPAEAWSRAHAGGGSGDDTTRIVPPGT